MTSIKAIIMIILKIHNIHKWLERTSNLQPHTYHAHALTTALSGRTARCA